MDGETMDEIFIVSPAEDEGSLGKWMDGWMEGWLSGYKDGGWVDI